MGEVTALSYSFDPEGETTVGGTARMHERNVGIFEQLFNHRFRWFAVRKTGIDQILIRVVGAKCTARTKFRGIFGLLISPTRISVHENRAGFGIRFAGC